MSHRLLCAAMHLGPCPHVSLYPLMHSALRQGFLEAELALLLWAHGAWLLRPPRSMDPRCWMQGLGSHCHDVRGSSPSMCIVGPVASLCLAPGPLRRGSWEAVAA